MKNARFPLTLRDGPVSLKIYRSESARTKSGFLFQVAFHDGGGRRIRQFVDLRKAEDFARLTLAQLRAGRREEELVSRADKDLLTTARGILEGFPLLEALREWKRARELTRDNLLEAAQRWADANPTGSERVPLAEAVERFIAAKESQGVGTKRAYGNRLQSLCESFPNMDMRDITATALSAALDKIPHPATRNATRKNYVSLWRWARDAGIVPEGRRTEAEKTMRAKEPEKVPEVLTPTQFATVLSAVTTEAPEHVASIVLGGLCGLRAKERAGQVWEDIDLAQGVLTVTRAKPNTPAFRMVQIPPAAVAWLLRCADRTGNVEKAATAKKQRANEIAKAHGVTVPHNALRHSAITYRIAAGETHGAVANWAGTSETMVNQHYRKPAARADGERWFALTPEAVLSESTVVEMEVAK